MKKFLMALLALFILVSCGEKEPVQKAESVPAFYVGNKNKLWRKGQDIKIAFIEGSDEEIQKVKKYGSEWFKYANLNPIFVDLRSGKEIPMGSKRPEVEEEKPKKKKGFFGRRSKENNSSFNPFDRSSYVSSSRSTGGADIKIQINSGLHINDSYVGIDSKRKKPSMRLTSLDANTIMHEFGHALGLHHEHLNPKNGIEFDEQMMKEVYCPSVFGSSKSQIEYCLQSVTRKKSGSRYIISNYDNQSVMNYDFHNKYYKNGSPKAARFADRLSLMDRIGISRIYPGKEGVNEKQIREDFELEMVELERNILETDTSNSKCMVVTPSDILKRYNQKRCAEGEFALGIKTRDGSFNLVHGSCSANIYEAARRLEKEPYCL